MGIGTPNPRRDARLGRVAAPRGGFTLIEILVVIGVIALLIGLLLPAMKGARTAARTAVCLSNQRQIGVGLTMYADTYREFTPRESGFSEPRVPPTPIERFYPPWAYVLRPFLDDRAPTTDPQVDMSGGIGDLFVFANYYQDPARTKDRHNIHYVNNGISFRAPGLVNDFAKRPTKMSKYLRPHETLYLSCFTDDPTQVHANEWYAAGTTNWRIAVAYDMHHASNVTGGVQTPQGSQRIAPNRHEKGANAVYLDGHAVLVSAREITTLSRWDDLDYRPDDPPFPFP